MRRKTNEEFLEQVKNSKNKDFVILSEYINRRTKVKVRALCGHVWETMPDTIIQGYGCPICSKSIKRTTEDFKKEVYNLVKDEYSVIGEYISTSDYIKMKHNSFGHEFDIMPKMFLRGKRCPIETYEKRDLGYRKNLDLVKQELSSIDGGYTIVSEYTGVSNKVDLKHEKCGNIRNTKPNNIINNNLACRYCHGSIGEMFISHYLEENNYDFKREFKSKNCKNKRSLPFDFAIFKNNELVFLIEYDGEQHTKAKFGEKNLKITQKNDNIKNKFCKDNNIKLIRIPYKRTSNSSKFKEYLFNELNKKLQS